MAMTDRKITREAKNNKSGTYAFYNTSFSRITSFSTRRWLTSLAGEILGSHLTNSNMFLATRAGFNASADVNIRLQLSHLDLVLPEGSSVVTAVGHGASYWSQSGRIDVRLSSGQNESYFIKLSRTEVGKVMVEGEFESMKMLHLVSPHMVPKPIGFGTYESDSDIHFFLCEYVDLYDELPDVVDFCRSVAELHMNSMDHSPNSKFGFPVVTCNGTVQQHTEWNSSWEAFYIESLKKAFKLEEDVHGFSPEISEMLPDLFEKVCPRLLRPLETEGRNLRPCLIHGDLWDGNVAVHAKTGRPYIFDASAFWAHNEYELHIWKGTRYRIRKTFVKEYFNHFPISPPKDDWEDRHLLYSLRADLHSSILFKQTEKFRQLLIQSLRQLVDKFPNGYEGPAARKDNTEP
ncbi:MAG: hypothetical protein M1820_008541 [Bogoriella megaspora]|nr:MAG: hypothetical protein M1820_008541 [Bogoriella megaspora]